MSMHPRMRAMVIRRLGTGRGGQGVPILLRQSTDGTFNPETGELEQTYIDYPGSGVRVNFSEYTHRSFDIPYSDYQIYLSPVQSDNQSEMPVPAIDDVLVMKYDNAFAGSQSWYSGSLTNYSGNSGVYPVGGIAKVVEVHPFNENGDSCGWKIRVKTS